MGIFTKRSENAETASSNELLNSFITKSEGLQRILNKETEYFREMKMKQAEMLVETKLALIEEIEVIRAKLTANPALLKNISIDEKVKLKAANDSLMKAAEENYQETAKAREVNKLILEAIADAVASHNQIDGAYTDKGKTYGSSSASSPITVSQNV